jgi:hypothetical protein
MIAEITTVGYIERKIPIYPTKDEMDRKLDGTHETDEARCPCRKTIFRRMLGTGFTVAEASPKTKSSRIHPLHTSRVLCDCQVMPAYHSGGRVHGLDIPDSRRHLDVSSISGQERTQ